MTGLLLGESPRWHDGRLWFSDWGAQEVIAVDLEGRSEVIARVPSFPFSIDWLPDGRLLIVSASTRLLLRREPDGSLTTHADLSALSDQPWNEIVVDVVAVLDRGVTAPWSMRVTVHFVKAVLLLLHASSSLLVSPRTLPGRDVPDETPFRLPINMFDVSIKVPVH